MSSDHPRTLAGLVPAFVGTGILVVAAAILCFVPGFGRLNYFFSFALGLVAYPAALVVGALVARDRMEPGGTITRLAFAGGLLAVLPLVVVLLNGIRVPTCNYASGLVYYLVSVGLGVVQGVLMGGALRVLVVRRGRAVLLAAAYFLSGLVYALYRLYAEPPVTAYHPGVGFFSGAVYEDVVTISDTLALYRAWTLSQALLATGIIRLAYRWRHHERLSWPSKVSLVMAGVLVCFFLVAGGPLGYDRSAEDIQSALGGHRSTEHFELYYDHATMADKDVDLLALDCEFRYDQIVAALGTAPPKKLEVYVYGSSEQKRALMGAYKVHISKPWRHEVHTSTYSFGRTILKHELVHAMTGHIAGGLLGVPTELGVVPVMGLVEGIAEAVTWSGAVLTDHQLAKAFLQLDKLPRASSLMDAAGFYSVQARLAYPSSSSLVKYLVDHGCGMPGVVASYAEGSIAPCAPEGVDGLDAPWHEFLQSQVSLTQAEQDYAAFTIKRPPIFRRICPFEIGRLLDEAHESLAAYDLAGATASYQTILGYDPDNPAHHLSLASIALLGGDPAAATAALEPLTSGPDIDPLYRTTLDELQGDIAWIAGDTATAESTYQALLEGAFLPGDIRTLTVKLLAVLDPALSEVLIPLLVAPPRHYSALAALTQASASLPDSWLVSYLLGRLETGAGHHGAAITHLEASLAQAPPGYPEIRKETYRLLGVDYLIVGQLTEAKASFEAYQAAATREVEQLLAADWLARVAWQAAHAPMGN